MNLNCKAGDMAMVVRPQLFVTRCPNCGSEVRPLRFGIPVKCVELVLTRQGPSWRIEAPVWVTAKYPCGYEWSGLAGGMPDMVLQPMPGLGSDEGAPESVEKPEGIEA